MGAKSLSPKARVRGVSQLSSKREVQKLQARDWGRHRRLELEAGLTAKREQADASLRVASDTSLVAAEPAAKLEPKLQLKPTPSFLKQKIDSALSRWRTSNEPTSMQRVRGNSA